MGGKGCEHVVECQLIGQLVLVGMLHVTKVVVLHLQFMKLLKHIRLAAHVVGQIRIILVSYFIIEVGPARGKSALWVC